MEILIMFVISLSVLGGIIWAAAVTGGWALALYIVVGMLIAGKWVRQNGADMAAWGFVVMLLWPVYLVNFSGTEKH